MLRFSFYFYFIIIHFALTVFSQGGINCTISPDGSTGVKFCDFYAGQAYMCEIEAFNVVAACEYGGSIWYACSLYVWKNGSYVAGTSGWLGQNAPWFYWSTYFPVNARDHIEITVVYETLNFCLGNSLSPPTLTIIDAVHMGGGKSNNKLSHLINSEIASGFKLEQNYPNPFNPVTTINYSIPYDGFVKLAVYNVLGEEVALLVRTFQVAGRYEVEFNA